MALVLAGATVLLAACGSQVDHQTFLAANGLTGSGGGARINRRHGAPHGTTGHHGDHRHHGHDWHHRHRDDSSKGGEAASPLRRRAAPRRSRRSPDGAVGNCAGFKNQTGITNDKIVIANASDISGAGAGPLRGVAAGHRGLRRLLQRHPPRRHLWAEAAAGELDSKEDAGGDQQAYAKACEQAFAAVGSMSAFDMGGAKTAQDCGLPDLRSTSVNPERSQCTTCFAMQAVTQNHVQRAVPLYFKAKYPQASQHAAFLWVNQGAAAINAKNWIAAWTKLGYKVDYQAAIDVSEFNYTPYVQKMKEKGIRYVHYVGPYQYTVRLAKAMQQQGFTPDVFTQDPTAYDPGFVQQGGRRGQRLPGVPEHPAVRAGLRRTRR